MTNSVFSSPAEQLGQAAPIATPGAPGRPRRRGRVAKRRLEFSDPVAAVAAIEVATQPTFYRRMMRSIQEYQRDGRNAAELFDAIEMAYLRPLRVFGRHTPKNIDMAACRDALQVRAAEFRAGQPCMCCGETAVAAPLFAMASTSSDQTVGWSCGPCASQFRVLSLAYMLLNGITTNLPGPGMPASDLADLEAVYGTNLVALDRAFGELQRRE